jgi:hypothetical protein
LLSFSGHPGGIVTGLGRHMTDDLNDMAAFAQERTATAGTATVDGDVGAGIMWKSIEAGAAAQVWAATTPELADHNGAYLADCGLGVLDANPE